LFGRSLPTCCLLSNQSINLSIYPSIYLPVYIYIYIYISSTNQSMCLSFNLLSIFLSTKQSVGLSSTVLTSTPGGNEWSTSHPVALPQERPQYPSRRWLGESPRGSLDDLRKKNNVSYLQSFVVHIHISFKTGSFRRDVKYQRQKFCVPLTKWFSTPFSCDPFSLLCFLKCLQSLCVCAPHKLQQLNDFQLHGTYTAA